MANGNIVDPSQVGTSGLRGLNTKQGKERELKDFGLSSSPSEYKIRREMRPIEAPTQEVGRDGVGESTWDSGITSLTQLDNLANTRGELQPWYAQIGSGIAKGAVLAGTTLADGIFGTIIGIGNAAATGTFSGFWNNPFSNAMQNVNEWSEKVLPNYYTDAEREEPWYDNIFTANFIGDKFLKNLGFAVGAAYSGKLGAGVTSKILGLNKARQAFKGAVTASGEALSPTAAYQAYKEGNLFLDGVQLTEELANSAKKLKNAKPIMQLTGAISGAVGEARIEAIQNSEDWAKLHKEQLDNALLKVQEEEKQSLINEFPQYSTLSIDENGDFNEVLTPEGQAILDARVKAKFDYNGGLKKIAEDRLKMGNIDFTLNLPLLAISDAIQFAKFYAGGYNTAKKGSNILRSVASDGTVSYAAQKPSKFRNVLKIASKGIAEGPYEEMGQSVAGKVAGYKYASELNDFYGSKIDPDAEDETIDWLQATSKAIRDTYGTAAGWEEGFIGGLTGMIGIPGFRSVRNEEGKLQSPIYMQGGIKEDIEEISERNRRDDAIVSQLNNRVQSPEFLNYYQSAIRHNKYQKQMDEASDNNDNFEFKNAEHNQFINDVVMFDKAGRIQDLYDTIEEAGNIKIEDVNEIRHLTTNKETGTSVYDNMTDEEVMNQIKKQTSEAKEAVDKYRKISQDLQIRLGEDFDDEGIEEMTYYFSNIDNLEDRFKSLFNEVQSSLRTIAAEVERPIYDTDAHPEDKKEVTKLANNIRLLTALNPSSLSTILNSEENKGLMEALDSTVPFINKKFPTLSMQGVSDNMKDLSKIIARRNDFIDKYAGYISNPKSLQEKQAKQRDLVVNSKNEEEAKANKDTLVGANNLQEFRKGLDSITDSETRTELIDTLEKEGNKLAKAYKETRSYNTELSNAINNLDIDTETKNDAFELLRQHYNNSNSLEDLANPESQLLNNPESLYDDSLSEEENYAKFSKAQYAILTAINKANNNQKFKNRFPSKYLESVKKFDNPRGVTSRETTGDSGTATIPSVEGGEVSSYNPPVGNITPAMVNNENASLNSITPSNQKEPESGRLYYRPSIPELHIEASKAGDFRPFNVVAAERNSNVNFDLLYNYLKDSGAFDYVNNGNLKVGDELGFMIDPEFNNHTIFIVDKKNNQIVGSLDESENSVARYEGLSELERKIHKEFSDSNSKTKFYASPTTKVDKIMIGKIAYGTEEKDLIDIPNVDSNSVFGIVKNGFLSTNSKVDNDKVIKPMDLSKDGRMYILIPNAAGKYSPAAIRVKHFNREEYDPKDVKYNSTALFSNISDSLDKMAASITEDDLSESIKDLSRYLFLGDLHIDLLSGDKGNGIRFTKIQRDANKNEIYDDVNGKRVRREEVKTVFLTEKEDPNVMYEVVDGGIKSADLARGIEEIKNDILNTLLDFNLPIQVNLGMLNTPGYTKMLLESKVLTSNITNASVIGSWFTTDYFNRSGESQKATSPASIRVDTSRKVVTPVGGSEGAIDGIKMTVNSKTYYVDLSNNTVRNSNNRVIKTYPKNLLDLAYIQSVYGDRQNGNTMIKGVVLLPDGQVIDRNTGKYVTGKKKDSFIKELNTPTDTKKSNNIILDTIIKDQDSVDKTKTDSEYYYVLEDDGTYHKYKRVHSVIGNNWIESANTKKEVDSIRLKLLNLSNDIRQYNNYLKNLANKYNLDLSAFENKIDAKSVDTIINSIRDKLNGTNSQRALSAGSSIDTIIRDFFNSTSTPVKPDNLTEQAFNDLLTTLSSIKDSIEQSGETFITNNIVLYHKFSNGTRIAGEVDILAIDKDGNFKIYDVKTSKYSFYDFVDKYGRKTNYFKNKSSFQNMSQEEYYTKQLSTYKELFEAKYKTPIKTLAVIPFVLNYSGDKVSNITREKSIVINYKQVINTNEEVKETPSTSANVPSINSNLPLFNKNLEEKEHLEYLTSNHELSNSKVGYFVINGKLIKGYLTPIGNINGIELYMTKVPEISSGFKKDESFVAYNDFYAVLPNGVTRNLAQKSPTTFTEEDAKNYILKVANRSYDKLLSLSKESNILTDTPNNVEEATVNITVNEGGAKKATSIEADINTVNDEFEDELVLRAVDKPRPIWNKEKELSWLNKVLPQLEENDLIKIQKGLIKVARTGALAWGQFDRGVITLSDVAAEGTVYHEAFHAVFNLILDNDERQLLLKEAREKYGDKSDLELEEDMAEGFREYTLSRDTQGLGSKIINFFKELFAKVTNWKYMKPNLNAYYQAINQGKYVDSSNSKTSIIDLYNSNSTLQSIGSKFDYIKYLESIYPNSKVKGVVYHNTSTDYDEFDITKIKRGYGAYFSPYNHWANKYLGVTKLAVVNIENPLYIKDKTYSIDGLQKKLRDKTKQAIDNNKNDGLIGYTNPTYYKGEFEKGYIDVDHDNSKSEIVVLNPSNIHFLGSVADINGFREFINSNNKVIKNKLYNTDYNNLSEEAKEKWSESKWNSISQEEREQALMCLGV